MLSFQTAILTPASTTGPTESDALVMASYMASYWLFWKMTIEPNRAPILTVDMKCVPKLSKRTYQPCVLVAASSAFLKSG